MQQELEDFANKVSFIAFYISPLQLRLVCLLTISIRSTSQPLHSPTATAPQPAAPSSLPLSPAYSMNTSTPTKPYQPTTSKSQQRPQLFMKSLPSVLQIQTMESYLVDRTTDGSNWTSVTKHKSKLSVRTPTLRPVFDLMWWMRMKMQLNRRGRMV